VVIPLNNTNTTYLSRDSAVDFHNSLEFAKGRFLATMNIPSGAGFYADVFGPLPFAFGNIASEEYLIYIVK
jgi:hypothetical protein